MTAYTLQPRLSATLTTMYADVPVQCNAMGAEPLGGEETHPALPLPPCPSRVGHALPTQYTTTMQDLLTG